MARIPYATALLLEKRKPKGQNIIIGSDPMVINALVKKFSTTIEKFDENNPAFFSYLETEFDIPASVRESVNVWLNPPLSKNYEALRYLVGAIHPKMELKKMDEMVKSLASTATGFRNFDALYLIIVSKSPCGESWLNKPWEDSKNWLGQVELSQRLSWLHKDIAELVYARNENKAGLDNLGVSAKKATFLRNQKVSITRIYRTLIELSKWRNKKQNPEQTALLITHIWEN